MNSPAFHWFLRLWAAAAFFHFVGNPPTLRIGGATGPLAATSLGVALAALLVLVKPNLRGAVGALAALQVTTALLEAPILGNHMVITALVALVLLGALTQKDAWAAFAPGARAVTIACYGFAAFSKLNSGFFDPFVSCALAYSNRWLSGFGLPLISAGGPMAMVAIVGTTVTELLIPVLFLIPATRRFGVALGFLFHFAVSYDFQQHIYDFTALLLALFSLFLPDLTLLQLGKLPQPKKPRPLQLAVGVIAVSFVIAAIIPPTEGSYRLIKDGPWVLWIPFSLWVVVRTLQAIRRLGPAQPLGRPTAFAFAVLALAIFNGLTPYLELKTASGFNMYANLVTANGRSNHFLIPRTAQLSDAQAVRYQVLDSNDEGLAQYKDSGWWIPRERLLHYLAQRPGIEVQVAVNGGEFIKLTSADGVALPWWKERFGLFRSLDSNEPPRCQLQWLPAY